MRGHRRHCEEDSGQDRVAATVQVRVLVFNNAISCGGIFRRQRIWIVGNSSGWTR